MRFEIIKQAPDYIIFENGSILNCLTDRFLVIKNGKGFYKTVRLRVNGKPKTFKLHRLLAEAFIYNGENKPCVNHIDGDKLNNNLWNLEWCTHQENMKHAYDNGLIYTSDINIKAMKEAKEKLVIDLNTGVYYNSIKDAAESINITSANLGKWLRGERKNKSSLRFA